MEQGGAGTMDAVLTLSGVHAAYGHVKALKGISLTVMKGEIVTLIGANGAGKSTTLRAISGLLKVREGDIVFRGRSLCGLPAHAIVGLGIGHVPEGRRIFPKLTVEENLDVGAITERSRGVIRDRKARVFGMFPRLAERRQQAGGTLSGGEQQMLAIGRALMRDPEVLLLDEPTMGLAPVLVDAIFETVQALNREGKPILLVEQNAWHALKIAHRAYVMQTGTIVMEDVAAELARNPAVKESYLGG